MSRSRYCSTPLHNWDVLKPGNVRELKNVLERIVLTMLSALLGMGILNSLIGNKMSIVAYALVAAIFSLGLISKPFALFSQH
ncbi:hypothetical protein [Desulfosporosinus fructosivorans]